MSWPCSRFQPHAAIADAAWPAAVILSILAGRWGKELPGSVLIGGGVGDAGAPGMAHFPHHGRYFCGGAGVALFWVLGLAKLGGFHDVWE